MKCKFLHCAELEMGSNEGYFINDCSGVRTSLGVSGCASSECTHECEQENFTPGGGGSVRLQQLTG